MSDEPDVPAAPAPARFQDLRIAVGCRLRLLSSGFGRHTQFASTLIGYVENEFLIVRTPVDRGLSVRMQNGEWVKVRLFTGTDVAEFDVGLQRQFSAPISYWHLDWPAHVRLIPLRAVRRTPVDLAVQVQTEGAGSQPARCTDLSVRGAHLTAPQPLGESDATIVVCLELPRNGGGDTEKVSLTGKIRSVKAVAENGGQPAHHSHGIQFADVSERDALLLQHFVLHRPGS